MIKMNYFVVGTNDLAASVKFYDALFELTELNQVFATDRMTYWQAEDSDAAFAVAIPFNKEPATHGNGTMLGFSLSTAEEVIQIHQKALTLGGICEGKPNQRGPRFSAYVRDLDNNKLCFSEQID